MIVRNEETVEFNLFDFILTQNTTLTALLESVDYRSLITLSLVNQASFDAYIANKNQYINYVKEKYNISENTSDSEKSKALCQASENNDLEGIFILVKNLGAPLEREVIELKTAKFSYTRSIINCNTFFCGAVGKMFGSALLPAIICGHREAVRLLLKLGARTDLIARGTCGTPLQVALQFGRNDIAKILLDERDDHLNAYEGGGKEYQEDMIEYCKKIQL